MRVIGGRVVLTPGLAKPYKVVLQHELSNDTEHPVSTVKEGELIIRSEGPCWGTGLSVEGRFREGPPGQAGGRGSQWGLGQSDDGRRRRLVGELEAPQSAAAKVDVESCA